MNYLGILIIVGFHKLSAHGNESSICKETGRQGDCILLQLCPDIVKSLATLTPDAIRHFERSKCGDWKVCCPTLTTTTEKGVEVVSNQTISKVDYVIKNIIPSRQYCGLQQTDDRIHTETYTALDEIPWLVNFRGYRSANFAEMPSSEKYQTVCAGVLISSQHVLTTSTCIAEERFYVKSAVLGLYNPKQNISCIEDPILPECTDFVTEIPIQFVRYLEGSKLLIYKLQKRVTYSDYIRPICLPFNHTTRPKAGELLVTSGWSYEGNEGVSKKKVSSELLSSEECKVIAEEAIMRHQVNKNYVMCTKIQNDSVCRGDLGGPLTYSRKHQWFLEGLMNILQYANLTKPCSSNTHIIGEKITPEVLNSIIEALYELK